MLEFLLMVQVCSNLDGDCMWQRIAKFKTEEICVANGLASEPFTLRFKCVGIETTTERIPLPRPKPGVR